MAVLCRWILLLTVLLAAEPRLWAAGPPELALDAAVKAFEDAFYARAEAQLADFCQKNPSSPRLLEAILVQAQARIELTNYTGAIELLTAYQGKAGTNADQYLFWLAKANSLQGNWRTASDDYAKLVKEFPASPRCLEAVLGEAAARAALAQTEPSEWSRVIELLRQTNGWFQNAARTNAASALVPQGYLLMGEAQLATKDYRGAEETIQPVTKRPLSPRLAWQCQFLLCRIQLGAGLTNAALQNTTNLIAIAINAAQTNLLAESAAFQAVLHESLGQTNEAIAAYRRNLADGIPPERQRQALLKITGWSLAQDNIPQAMQTLEFFLSQFPDAPSADLAWLTLGELRLRQYEAGPSKRRIASATTNAPATTNNLQLAIECFTTLTNRFAQSPLLGKAQLNLGWCRGREGKLPEAQAAFQAAIEHLPVSKDLATAYFRLADVQSQQTNFAGAIKSYQAIIEKFGALPEVKTNLFEPALYEIVRTGLVGNDQVSATNALQNLLAWHAKSTNASRAVLLMAQDIAHRNDPAAARKMLLAFDKAVPDAPLRAERLLTVAATWEQESKWAEAVAQYDDWLVIFPKDAALPQAEYYRAWDTWQAGRLTNALTLFTNFVVRFPTHELAPRAQLWVADYYYNLGNNPEAERNYQVLLKNTNWPPSELTYQAQLMAGRAAVNRQGWDDAKAYFTKLYAQLNNITNESIVNLRVQALFEHGLTLMRVADPSETNKLANYEEATRVFGLICEVYPTNRLAVRAWGERANCNLQWALARQQYDSLTNVLDAYQHVVDSPLADVALRSEAKVGLAVTLSKWAEQKSGKDRIALREQALNHCLDVVYNKILIPNTNEQSDLFWTKKAGIEGLDQAHKLQAWSQEISLYQRLTNSVWPQMPASTIKQVAEAQANLEREKASR
jgi:TolA-binding protein